MHFSAMSAICISYDTSHPRESGCAWVRLWLSPPEVNLTRTVHLTHFYSFVTLHDMLHAKLLLQILVRVRSIV